MPDREAWLAYIPSAFQDSLGLLLFVTRNKEDAEKRVTRMRRNMGLRRSRVYLNKVAYARITIHEEEPENAEHHSQDEPGETDQGSPSV